MVVRVFCGADFENEHELKQFHEVLQLVDKEYAGSNKLVYVLSNFIVSGSQIDVAILTETGPAILELKNYKGEIHGNENGNWTVKTVDGEVTLPENVFLQLQRQKFDFIKKLNAIQEKGLINIEKDNRAKIKCWGYFEKGSTYDASQLDPRARTWFDVATADDLLVKIGYIRAGYLLRRKDLDTIVKELNLTEYGKKETEVKAVSTGHSQSAIPEVSVVTSGNEEFVQKMLTEDNPFPYPHPLEKPDFMVGGEEYLRWFENRYADARIPICFIVGVPGSGKSHFLNYLDYLFYRENRFRGLYLLYEARREEISEKNVWTSLFFEKEEEKRQKLHLSFNTEKILKDALAKQSVKDKMLAFYQKTLQEGSLDEHVLHDLAVCLTRLLGEEKAGICLAIDNVDEQLNLLSYKYGDDEKAVDILFGLVRSLTVGMKHILILLACTIDAYTRILKATRDGTITRRWSEQKEVLKELTREQSFELVAKYLKSWATKNKVSPPECPECTDPTDDSSIYPFSRTAIEYIHKVTGQTAGDIIFVCGECIKDMKERREVSIVKDEYLLHLLEKVHNVASGRVNLEVLKTDRLVVLEQLLARNLVALEQRATLRYGKLIDPKVLVNHLESFVDILGIKITKAPQVDDFRRPSRKLVTGDYLKIWQYKTKNIACKYLFCESRPLSPDKERQIFAKSIELQDVIDVESLIHEEKASHGLWIFSWMGGFSGAPFEIWDQMRKFEPIVEKISLDDTLYKIIGTIEEGGGDKKDLVVYIDRKYLRLTETLDRLIAQEKG